MIIPSIDLMDGQTVQLVGGEKKALDAGDPVPIAERFRLAGEIAVIDLDAALGRGNNRELIERVLRVASCRVGGGIRDIETARRWLDAGARRIILGTAARPDILRELPRERLIASVDAKEGDVVVEGWTKKTGRPILERIEELRDYVSGFLVTFVEREGRLGGTDLSRVEAIVKAAGKARVTIAGGVTTPEEIAELHRLGADAQVGMAIYTGKMHLADAIAAPLRSDRPDGLWPTVVCDERGLALGLAYSNMDSLRAAVDRQLGVYHSRKRGLWVKGETSGATQKLFAITPDCDADTIRFIVRQEGDGFCHLDQWTCFGDPAGLARLEQTLAARKQDAPQGSYTARLLSDSELLAAKLTEEASELARATTPGDVTGEAADMLYFTLVAMARAGVRLADVERELDRRALRITRRPGNAKNRITDE